MSQSETYVYLINRKSPDGSDWEASQQYPNPISATVALVEILNRDYQDHWVLINDWQFVLKFASANSFILACVVSSQKSAQWLREQDL